jgi:adenosylmethionine---8-amino-7-oxononanoate aminotransferase
MYNSRKDYGFLHPMTESQDASHLHDLHALDRAHVWHPYTRFSAVEEGLPMIVRGEGIYLYDDTGRRYVDAVSSWWACALGHSHPRLIRALQHQAEQLQHSILGNLSHPPAAHVAAKLAHLMPDSHRHVLFSSDGASAVEAALKMSLLYARNQGYESRQSFVSIEEAYHGDTLAAVGVGYVEAFHRPLRGLLPDVERLAFPDDLDRAYRDVDKLLHGRADHIAAVIVEPVCLGAAGMRIYDPAYLRHLSSLCRALDIPLIVDEIAMGFGRTGRMFAFEHAGIDPDLVCVGKALTGGYVPMSAVIARDNLYHTFADTPKDNTFYHGHTWSGNPIAAAVALETLAIFEEEHLVERAAAMSEKLKTWLEPFKQLPRVKEVRSLGLIAAIELEQDDDDEEPGARRVQRAMRERGYLARPLGPVLYLMMPLIATEQEHQDALNALNESIKETAN